MKKKEYNNIFAKMAEEHNKFVPTLRKLNLSTIKIKNRRIISLRDTLEVAEDVLMSIDLFTEYLCLNSIILSLVDKEELERSFELIKSRDKSNVFLGINLIYSLVEDRKELLKIDGK